MLLFNRKLRLAATMLFVAAASASAEPAARVVAVSDPAAVEWLQIDAARVAPMVSRGIRTLTGEPDDATAWAQLVSSNDVVGIKVNTQAAPLQAPRPALVDAIATGLAAAGVASTNIVVWDIENRHLRRAGYQPDGRYRLQAVKDERGWDEGRYFESEIIGKLIWGDLMYGKDDDNLSGRSHLPLLVTRFCTKIINVAVLQDHKDYGISGCLANLTVEAVDNNRRFAFGEQHGAPAVAEIGSVPELRNKVVLHVVDALVAGYAGGPSYKSNYSWSHATLYFSRDPVAIDALCLKLLDRKRAAAKISAIGLRGAHVAAAAKAGLGVADRDGIELVEVGP